MDVDKSFFYQLDFNPLSLFFATIVNIWLLGRFLLSKKYNTLFFCSQIKKNMYQTIASIVIVKYYKLKPEKIFKNKKEFCLRFPKL